MLFIDAVKLAQENGSRISRKSWGRGMFLEVAIELLFFHGQDNPYSPHVYDILADDWGVYVPHVGEKL